MHFPDARRLELYRQSLERAWGYRDYNDWPVKLNSVFHLFLPSFGCEFLEDLEYLLQNANWRLERVAQLFNNPARIYRAIDSVIYSMRRYRRSLLDQQKVVLTLLTLVRSIKYGSEFNEDGRNIILSPDSVCNEFAKLAGTCNSESQESALVHRLCGLLWAYSETIFFRAHDVTKEIHGPYTSSDFGGSLVIRDFFHLCPREMWHDMELLSANTIRVSLWYSPDLLLEIDALNHLYEHGAKSLRDATIAYQVYMNGILLRRTEIIELVHNLASCIHKNCDLVDSLNWHDRVERYAKIFWFRKAPLRVARGMCWQVPATVLESVKAGKPNPRRLKELSELDVRKLARLTI